MNKIFIFLLMIFLHIVDDYYLQGWLASAKQKKYWQDNAPDALYKYDYIWALIMHSFSWTFMIMLPVILFRTNLDYIKFIIVYIFNLGIHVYTDNCKANRKEINLWQDQLIHMSQIIGTFFVFFMEV